MTKHDHPEEGSWPNVDPSHFTPVLNTPPPPLSVSVSGESGDRVTIERNIVTVQEAIGTWPTDRASQRAWALSVVTQKIFFPVTKPDSDDMTQLFEQAQKVVDWVEDGVLP